MEVEDLELHDALIKCVSTDCVAKTMLLTLEYYPKGARGRLPLWLLFSDVESVSQMLSMDKLASNAFAGNVNYWIPEQNGLTHIYLSDGCIAIKAGRIAFS